MSHSLRALVSIAGLVVVCGLALLWGRRRFSRLRSRRATATVTIVATLSLTFFGWQSATVMRSSRAWSLPAHELMLLVFSTFTAWMCCVGFLELALLVPSAFARLRAPRRADAERSPSVAPPRDDEPTRREAIAKIGSGVIATIGTGMVAWGALRTRLDVEVVEVPIRIARLPRVLDGFTIVQISDIHIGPFFGERQLRDAEDVVRKLKPDLVAMTGDLIDVQRTFIPAGATFLSRLAPLARHGVAAIPGNHEHYAGVELVMDAVRRAGSDVLLNEGRLIAPSDGGGFALVGVDDVSAYERGKGGPRVARSLSLLPPDRARVLLCHQPSYLPSAAANEFDLMLSGHTHGGQVAPLGTLVVSALFANSSGLGRLRDTQIYVNRGLGTSGPPVRIAIRPEITKIVLVAG